MLEENEYKKMLDDFEKKAEVSYYNDNKEEETMAEFKTETDSIPNVGEIMTENAVDTVPIMIGEDVEEINIDNEEEVSNVVELSKKYRFEGEIIDTIDLSGIENITGEEAQVIDKLYRKITKNPSVTPELTLDYAMAAASILSGLPVEFFKHISMKDILKMKNRIINFLYAD